MVRLSMKQNARDYLINGDSHRLLRSFSIFGFSQSHSQEHLYPQRQFKSVRIEETEGQRLGSDQEAMDGVGGVAGWLRRDFS